MSAFFDSIRKSLFGGTLTQGQVDGINALVDAWHQMGDGDPRKLAYVLATTKRETGSTMQPIEEYGKGKGLPYGLPAGPWHKVYDGRGDVQLTFESNYVKATTELHKRGLFLDVDLDKSPELAMRQDIAAAIIVYGMREGWFTGKRLSDYIGPTGANYLGARRIVNGMDHAAEIAGFAAAFEAAIKSDPVVLALASTIGTAPVAKPAPPVAAPYPPLPSPAPVTTAPVAPPAGWGSLLVAIVKLIAGVASAVFIKKKAAA